MSKLDLNKKLGFWPLEVETWPKIELWHFFTKLTPASQWKARESASHPSRLEPSAECLKFFYDPSLEAILFSAPAEARLRVAGLEHCPT